MVIESTSTRTIIDLLESLRKNSFTSTQIRISYTQKDGTKRYVTFSTLDELKTHYAQNYQKTANSKRSPFTSDPRLAIQEPVSTTIGNFLYNTYEPYQLYFESSSFFCSTGSLVTIESVNISSYMKGYEMNFTLKDIVNNLKIITSSKFDLRRQSAIAEVVERFKKSVQDFVSVYNKIYGRLNLLYIQGQYVDLCYAIIGYVQFTFELYKLFFVINKRPINAGINIDVLKKMYIRAPGLPEEDTVIINGQTWMVKNLDITQYRNGDPIPQVTDAVDWSFSATGDEPYGAWCYYNNDPNNNTVYGKLYNRYVFEDPRGFGPVGWKVPTLRELKLMTSYLGIGAGGKLKESGTSHWSSPNIGANNSSGFTALPGGKRIEDGSFEDIGDSAYFWSVDSVSGEDNYLTLSSGLESVDYGQGFENWGASVRCIKGL
jgi:uncharacterized protein (TIGR02145 family)